MHVVMQIIPPRNTRNVSHINLMKADFEKTACNSPYVGDPTSSVYCFADQRTQCSLSRKGDMLLSWTVSPLHIAGRKTAKKQP